MAGPIVFPRYWAPVTRLMLWFMRWSGTLTLVSATGRREVNINDFYLGYKKLALKLGELIAEVCIPLPSDDEVLELYKVSRRRDLDISGFTAALRLRLSVDDTIERASIALGGVGPVVIRPRRA